VKFIFEIIYLQVQLEYLLPYRDKDVIQISSSSNMGTRANLNFYFRERGQQTHTHHMVLLFVDMHVLNMVPNSSQLDPTLCN